MASCTDVLPYSTSFFVRLVKAKQHDLNNKRQVKAALLYLHNKSAHLHIKKKRIACLKRLIFLSYFSSVHIFPHTLVLSVALPALYTVVCIIFMPFSNSWRSWEAEHSVLLSMNQYLAEQIKIGCVNSAVILPGDQYTLKVLNPSCLVCMHTRV